MCKNLYKSRILSCNHGEETEIIPEHKDSVGRPSEAIIDIQKSSGDAPDFGLKPIEFDKTGLPITLPKNNGDGVLGIEVKRKRKSRSLWTRTRAFVKHSLCCCWSIDKIDYEFSSPPWKLPFYLYYRRLFTTCFELK